MSNQPQIGIVPIGSLTPYDKSARVHNRQQRRKLRTILKRFGQVLPISSTTMASSSMAMPCGRN